MSKELQSDIKALSLSLISAGLIALLLRQNNAFFSLLCVTIGAVMYFYFSDYE